MPNPTSRARASRALRRAISLTPASHPLRQSLQVLSNPLIYYSSHTHLDDSTWQATLNHLTTFADRVIQSLNNQHDNQALSSLEDDAIKLHQTLDRKGFHTAFHPSHVWAQNFSALSACADSSENTEANMRVVSASLPATFQCLERIFNTPVTLVDPIGTLCSVADQYRYSTPPPPSAIVPPVDTTYFANLHSSYNSFMDKLNRVPIPELGRKRVKTFVDLLWHQNLLSDKNISTELTTTSIPSFGQLGASDHSMVVNAHLDFIDDQAGKSTKLWTTKVALKALGLPPTSQKSRLAIKQETLRLKALTHPCIPVFYGAICPSSNNGTNPPEILHLITERMTHSVRAARHDPALRPFEVRIRILRDVADALWYLHAQQMFHASLSPDNVLVRVYEDTIYGRAKVDVTCLATRTLTWNERKHPLVYRAPETFSSKEAFFTSDIWSFGVLACFLLADKGNEESDNVFIRAVAAKGEAGTVAREWATRIANDRAKDLVIRCLHRQPERRPNAEEIYIDTSDILRQKSVKADTATPATSPVRERMSEAVRGDKEDVRDMHFTNQDLTDRSLAECEEKDSSRKNGQVLTPARKTAPGPRQESRPGDTMLESERPLSPELEISSAVFENGRDGEGLRFPAEIPDETGLDDIFRFQVDERGRTRCVRRRPSNETTPRPTKRVKHSSPQQTLPESLDNTAGLRQATMEEIFGPFSPSELRTDLREDHVKSESALETECTINDTSDVRRGKTLRAKVEVTVSNNREVTNNAHSHLRDQQDTMDSSRNVGHGVQAKTEPTLVPQRSGTTISARKLPTAVAHEGRRIRPSRRERGRSRSGCPGASEEAHRPHTQLAETPTSAVWKNRIRKRTPRSLMHADRSPSPSPSSMSHCLDSNESCPSDNIRDVEGVNSLLRIRKGVRVDKPRETRKSDSQRGCQSPGDASKKVKDNPKASLSTAPATCTHFDSQMDISLSFIKGAREGESLVDYYRRESLNGNTSAFVRMGVLYEEGQDVKCDYGVAFSCYQQAAAAGNSEGQLRLARCYEDGRGVSKNEPAAAALFIQAADADNAHAQFRAGICFAEGRGVVKDLKKALHYLNKSVEQRDPEACYKVAEFCKEGKGLRKDEARAFELFKIASDAGHVLSTVQLANMYAKGVGGAKRSITKAVALYRQASDAGNPGAKLSLGLLHEDGQGVKKSSESALKLYREAADIGYAPAMTALGQCFLWGYGVKQDFNKAVDLFRNAAQQDDSLAQHELGNCYKEGTGVEQDNSKALYFYKKASALGSAVALVQYGEFLYSGHGISQDYERAFEQFKKAAELGAAEGYRWLGECYADGTGVKQDVKKAFQMYMKGADLGSSYAQTCLGVCYENGTGVERSKTKALHWYRKAAAEGNHTAMNNLGIFYEQGRLVKRDPKRAVSYYRKAIDLGSIDAICNLADCYASGKGIERDLQKAVQHYQDAADHGMSGAVCELGVCYYYGRGVRQNFMKAVGLFKEASDSEPEALRHLGTGFYDGKGVERDYVAAVDLYKRAIESGNNDANYNLALCYSYGKGVKKDDDQATSLFQTAADHGNRYAKLALGNRYFEGRGVSKNIKQAVTLFQEAGEVDFTQPLTDDRIMSDEPQLAGKKNIVNTS